MWEQVEADILRNLQAICSEEGIPVIVRTWCHLEEPTWTYAGDDMILEKGNPDETPGAWAHATTDGKPTARISCPRCGLALNLVPEVSTGHIVHEDGSVEPSIVCVGLGCDFHEYIALRDWEPQLP